MSGKLKVGIDGSDFGQCLHHDPGFGYHLTL
jgi:hypothetical protein